MSFNVLLNALLTQCKASRFLDTDDIFALILIQFPLFIFTLFPSTEEISNLIFLCNIPRVGG